MTTAELITAALSYFLNQGGPGITTNETQRKKAHFFATKVAKRVLNSAPLWFKNASSSIALTAGVGTLPADFSHLGTMGQIYVSTHPSHPIEYRSPDIIDYLVLNQSQQGIPQLFTFSGKSSLGIPKILCWPQDASTVLVKNYVRKTPELIDAPLAPHPTALVTAGLPNGAYTYRVTNVTASGETEGGDVSASITVALKQISVSLPLWWGRTVTSRKLYRTVAGGAQHKLVATIADNLTTTYTDNVADGSLGADCPLPAAAVTGLELFPDEFHESAFFDGLCYLLGNSQGDGRIAELSVAFDRGVRRLWEEIQPGQNQVSAFPPYPGKNPWQGHPVWSRWTPPS